LTVIYWKLEVPKVKHDFQLTGARTKFVIVLLVY